MAEYSLEIVFTTEESARSPGDPRRWALTVARSAVGWVLRNKRVERITSAYLRHHTGRPPAYDQRWDLTPLVREAEDATAAGD